MSTKTIKKYLAEGVLNYVEHATPRHYFLYDGVMDEENADVHRLVEDLCDENMELQKRVKELEHILASGPCEIAAHSNKLTEYMFHWEGRALDAEAKLAKAVEVAEKSIQWLRLYGADVHREAATLAELKGEK